MDGGHAAALFKLIRIFGRFTARGASLAKRHGLTLPHLEDLDAEPLGHISGGHLAALQGAGSDLRAKLRHDVALGQAALAEFLASDIVVRTNENFRPGLYRPSVAMVQRVPAAERLRAQGPGIFATWPRP